jgi:hypothetical protein
MCLSVIRLLIPLACAAAAFAQAHLQSMAIDPIVIDHTTTDLSKIPDYWIAQARAMTLYYGFTSHGSQIVSGLEALQSIDPKYNSAVLRYSPTFRLPDATNALRILGGTPEDYVTPELFWSEPGGRANTQAAASTGLFRAAAWAWCGQQSDNSTATVQQYLNAMNAFEAANPSMRFILFTGHTDGGSATLTRNNNTVRDYARQNGKVLFDFADIESWDPAGNHYPDTADDCAWCDSWCQSHPADCAVLPDDCAHSHPFNCVLKARAFWWMMARLAGWSGPGTASSPPSAAAVDTGTPRAGLAQKMTFTFTDPAGWQDLDVVNVLINGFLDGRNACYLAYSRSAGVLYLVNDPGTALLPGLALNGPGTTGNSQCTVSGAASSATGAGNTLTLALDLSFGAGFAGNKVVYLAARDLQGGNSGWQALGTWGVPGVTASPSADGVNPARGSGASRTFTFTFADTKGYQGLGLVDILINNSLDGRQACYVAFVPMGSNSGAVYLVDDAGNAGGPYQGLLLPGSGAASNSQCSIAGAGSSVSGSGNTLTLTLAITFKAPFAGNRIVYLSAQDGTSNSGWQAMGAWTVP